MSLFSYTLYDLVITTISYMENKYILLYEYKQELRGDPA